MKRDGLIPDPLSSDRQYLRFHHLDLSNLNDMELVDEFNRLRTLLWGAPPNHWLRERVARLESELRKRQIINLELRRRLKLKPTGVIPL